MTSSTPNGIATSQVKSQTKTTTLKFISENTFSILETKYNAQTTATSEISNTHQEKKKFPNFHSSQTNYFNVIKDLKKATTTDISKTFIHQAIRFHFS
jgi:hypothetical protein